MNKIKKQLITRNNLAKNIYHIFSTIKTKPNKK